MHSNCSQLFTFYTIGDEVSRDISSFQSSPRSFEILGELDSALARNQSISSRFYFVVEFRTGSGTNFGTNPERSSVVCLLAKETVNDFFSPVPYFLSSFLL